ncbi:hypothetical protein DL95DRAFT_422232 [Leptodontidium sp. 2 PMI_412]|nr:hypothetical protein DL95DRAFT_422232 [Leptodontidium sp. 2 PMI_412]
MLCPFTPYPLSRHIFTLLDPVSPSDGIRQSLHLAQLLILSNRLSQANTLLSAIYTHGQFIIPPSPYEESKVDTYNSLEAFWLDHPSTHPRPANAPALYTSKDQTLEEKLEYELWGKFRECTLTGWMHEHCNLRKPKDAHCWREGCSLCYVSLARMQEALDAALKLYALPVKKGEYDGSKEAKCRRYCSLLYKRLPVELAIRLGELDIARGILSVALCQDGFCNGGGGGKEGNAYFITEGDTEVLVKGVIGALKLRAKEGRQWSLAPEKVTWKGLEYREKGVSSWRGVLNEPASEEEIEEAEKKLGELPRDFKEMCRVSDGFKGGYLFLAGGLAGIESMFFDGGETELEHHAGDFYRREIDLSQETSHDMIQMISGEESEEYRYYNIPHRMWKDIVKRGDVGEGEYQYWHVTNHWGWDWVASMVEEVEGIVEKGEKESEDEESEMEGGNEEEENTKENAGEQNKKLEVGDESDKWVRMDEMPMQI